MNTATATACANIALIKYWGNRDNSLRLPANGSISMNLAALFTRTRVTYDPALLEDMLTINAAPATGASLARVQCFMDEVRQLTGIRLYAEVSSENNFPISAGIASSASAFAALSLAAAGAAGFSLDEAALSRMARRGSGSASRSVPGGFVEWQAGSGDEDSFSVSIAAAEHWKLADVIALVNAGEKATGSSEGHALAATSPLQAARVADAPRRLALCRQAVLQRDFDILAEVTELDSNLMHAVMITSTPACIYWAPASLAAMQSVIGWRNAGMPVCYTLDAGPNVHIICPVEEMDKVARLVGQIPGVGKVLTSQVGGAARLI
jgi:diphosphomevalonate decarboxylase